MDAARGSPRRDDDATTTLALEPKKLRRALSETDVAKLRRVLPEEVLRRIWLYALPRMRPAVKEELAWCFVAAEALRARLDAGRFLGSHALASDEFSRAPAAADFGHPPRRSATGASVAAALLIRRSGRDVRLGGSGARRTLHFPRRRRRRRAGPRRGDADDSDDDGDAGLGGRPSCSAFTRAL